jgi:hypothetical protein
MAEPEKPRRRTVGYLYAMLPEEPDWTDKFKGDVGRACKATIEDWLIDYQQSGEFASDLVLRKLIVQMNQGLIGAVAYMGDTYLPDDPELVGEFFDAALDNDVELCTEQGTPYPERKLLAQIGALLAEHERTTEEWWLNKRGQITLRLGVAESADLRRMCEADGGKVAKSFLRQTQHIEIDDGVQIDEPDDYGGFIEEFLVKLLDELTAKGWLAGWEEQPDNGSGGIWVKVVTPHMKEGYYSQMLSYDEAPHAIQGFVSGVKAATGVAPFGNVEIPFAPKPPATQEPNLIERHRAAIALRRKDAHVSPTHVRCAYDHCGSRFTATGGVDAWIQALAAGWRVIHPSDLTSTDLCCPDEHDEFGRNKTYA